MIRPRFSPSDPVAVTSAIPTVDQRETGGVGASSRKIGGFAPLGPSTSTTSSAKKAHTIVTGSATLVKKR